MQAFRRWWRRARSEIRYLVEQEMVWRELKRRPNRRFVRVLFVSKYNRPPVIGPVQSGEDVTDALIHTFMKGGIHLTDPTDLIPLERRLDAVFAKTNFVDMRVQYQYGGLHVQIMPHRRLEKPPLPSLPDWNDPNAIEWDLV